MWAFKWAFFTVRTNTHSPTTEIVKKNMLNPTSVPSSRTPAPQQGEVFLLHRTGGMSCEITVPGLPTLKGTTNGEITLTTKRLVFTNTVPIPLGPQATFHAFEFPLTTLTGEKFNQPIFGANNLTGTVQPLEGSGLPGQASFKLVFHEGGCGTFLHFFFRALRELRGANNNLVNAAQQGKLQTENAAFLDPNDSSVIYLVQPQAS